MRTSLLALAFCLAVATPVLAQKPTGKESREPNRRAAALVAMLASKNERPQDHDPISVPEGYSKREQAIVFLAIQQLLAEGSDAFDELVKHLGDKRYSYSYESPSGRYWKTVGVTCHQIMRRNIECYEGELIYITADQDNMYLNKEGKGYDLAKWWETNHERPLWQIQIEAIDSAIAFMKKADVEELRSTHMHAKKFNKEKFDELRQKNIEILQARRKSIEAVKEAFRPRDLEYPYGSMTLLPWPNRNWGR